MAKKRTKKSPEEEAYQELLKKAIALEKSRQTKEENQRALQVGKELAMFFRWLQALKVGNLLTDELAKVWLVQVLKDYPTQQKKALAFYDALQKYPIMGNFEGFQVSPDSLEKGRLWLSPNWINFDLPAGGIGGGAGEESGEGQE